MVDTILQIKNLDDSLESIMRINSFNNLVNSLLTLDNSLAAGKNPDSAVSDFYKNVTPQMFPKTSLEISVLTSKLKLMHPNPMYALETKQILNSFLNNLIERNYDDFELDFDLGMNKPEKSMKQVKIKILEDLDYSKNRNLDRKKFKTNDKFNARIDYMGIVDYGSPLGTPDFMQLVRTYNGRNPKERNSYREIPDWFIENEEYIEYTKCDATFHKLAKAYLLGRNSKFIFKNTSRINGRFYDSELVFEKEAQVESWTKNCIIHYLSDASSNFTSSNSTFHIHKGIKPWGTFSVPHDDFDNQLPFGCKFITYNEDAFNTIKNFMRQAREKKVNGYGYLLQSPIVGSVSMYSGTEYVGQDFVYGSPDAKGFNKTKDFWSQTANNLILMKNNAIAAHLNV